MSTRANIKIIESWPGEKKKLHTSELLFYRHSDGYPEGTLPTLEIFMGWVKRRKIRNNIGQAAGWLIMIGAMEYKTIQPEAFAGEQYTAAFEPQEWKVGAYEPTDQIQGDIEYLYELDLSQMEIRIFEVKYALPKDPDEIGKKKIKQSFELVETKKF